MIKFRHKLNQMLLNRGLVTITSILKTNTLAGLKYLICCLSSCKNMLSRYCAVLISMQINSFKCRVTAEHMDDGSHFERIVINSCC